MAAKLPDEKQLGIDETPTKQGPDKAWLWTYLTPRFSLRAMLVVVTVGCVVIGWRANRLWTNQRAIESLKKNGLIVQRSVFPALYHELSFWKRVDVTEVVMWGDDRNGLNNKDFPELWRDISNLTPLNSLLIEDVTLPTRRQSKRGNRPISATEIEFNHCSFRDDAFENSIEQVPRLKTLRLISGKLDLRQLSCLSQSASMESLEIYMDAIPANIINSFGGRNFRRLELYAATEDEKLGRIDLSEMDVNAIMAMEQLEVLMITGMPGFPVSRLPQFKKFKKLKYLSLALKDLPDADLKTAREDLESALPDCEQCLYSVPEQ